MQYIIALGSLLPLPILIWLYRKGRYSFQYVYFLRVPIVLLFVLIFGPFAAQSLGITNLWILGNFSMAFVAFVATLTAWTIIHAARFVYAWAPNRTQLAYHGPESEKKVPDPDYAGSGNHSDRQQLTNKLIQDNRWGIRHLLYAAPALPLIVLAINQSAGPDSGGKQLALLAWAVSGVATAFLVRLIFLIQSHSPDVEKHVVGCAAEELANRNFYRFILFTASLYVLLGALLNPWIRHPLAILVQDRMPTLVYVLMLIMLLAWAGSWLGLKLDKYRIPAELAVIAGMSAIWWFFDTDHHYQTFEDGGHPALAPEDYYQSWQSQRNPGVLPIVVAASGGGITASYWTTTVLMGLQEATGNQFAESVALISATSGGAVGAMYYLDAFAYDEEDNRAVVPSLSPREKGLWGVERCGLGSANGDEPGPSHPEIVAKSGCSSLGAMGWGFVFPDTVRAVAPFLLSDIDRGWSIERRWSQELDDPNKLWSDWAEDVRAGWRPAPIFNATFTETGGRFLLTPLSIGGGGSCQDENTDPARPSDDVGEPWRANTFDECYGGADIRIVTAARLSATFPYVTPLARPTIETNNAYHVGDGGYFDNFGVMSIVDFLNRVFEKPESALPPKLLILEIRASNSSNRSAPADNSGFDMATFGPLRTLMSVRTTSQLERNELELQLLTKRWADKTRILRAIFELREPSPLSWHLSDANRRTIHDHWQTSALEPNGDNREAMCSVQRFLGGATDADCLRATGSVTY